VTTRVPNSGWWGAVPYRYGAHAPAQHLTSFVSLICWKSTTIGQNLRLWKFAHTAHTSQSGWNLVRPTARRWAPAAGRQAQEHKRQCHVRLIACWTPTDFKRLIVTWHCGSVPGWHGRACRKCIKVCFTRNMIHTLSPMIMLNCQTYRYCEFSRGSYPNCKQQVATGCSPAPPTPLQ
jgi:hypothetical protein